MDILDQITLKRLALEFNAMSIFGVRQKIVEYKYKLETANDPEQSKTAAIMEMLELILANKKRFAEFYMMAGMWCLKYSQNKTRRGRRERRQ